ncbi:MAG: pyridoxamine 5'-phosphate oxidase [Acidimicrobiia bacterium]
MATMDDVRKMSMADHGLAVVSTTRADGSVHSTLVNAGVMNHPVTGAVVVAFVVRGNALKRTLLRKSGRASLVFRSGWRWAGVEGPVDLIGPDDDGDGFATGDVPALLRDVFTAAGGTHDNWDEYDRVMAAEGRAAVFITPTRVLGDA